MKKCWLYLDILSCVKIVVFRFQTRDACHQYKTGADRGNILGQPMLCECMGICVVCPAHDEGLPCSSADCKILNRFWLIQPQYIRVDGFVMDCFGEFQNHF